MEVLMNLQWPDVDSEERFFAYVERLSKALRQPHRVGPVRLNCINLLLPGERKSIEPVAARLRPERMAAEHQSHWHFMDVSPWDESELLRAVCAAVLTASCDRFCNQS